MPISPETLETIATVYAPIINCVCVVFGTLFALWTFAANSAASRRQKTIEFYRGISDKCDKYLRKIRGFSTGDGLIDYEGAKADPGSFYGTIEYLSLMEEFSVGLNSGVFDIGTFYRIEGIRCIKWFGRLSGFIEAYRREKGREDLYIDFQKMVYRLSVIRNSEASLEQRYPAAVRGYIARSSAAPAAAS